MSRPPCSAFYAWFIVVELGTGHSHCASAANALFPAPIIGINDSASKKIIKIVAAFFFITSLYLLCHLFAFIRQIIPFSEKDQQNTSLSSKPMFPSFLNYSIPEDPIYQKGGATGSA